MLATGDITFYAPMTSRGIVVSPFKGQAEIVIEKILLQNKSIILEITVTCPAMLNRFRQSIAAFVKYN
jgi:hypothetical protein